MEISTKMTQILESADKDFKVDIITMGFPDSSVGKEPTCSAGDLGSIPGSGRCLGEGNGNPLQYSPWWLSGKELDTTERLSLLQGNTEVET